MDVNVNLKFEPEFSVQICVHSALKWLYFQIITMCTYIDGKCHLCNSVLCCPVSLSTQCACLA